MAQLVADVAVVPGLVQRLREVAVEVFLPQTAVRPADVAEDATVGVAFVFAAEVREDLQRADVANRLSHVADALLLGERRVEAGFQGRGSDFADHAQHILIILDDRRMILQRERDAVLACVLRGFDQPVTTPVPRLFACELLVRRGPHAPRDVVAAAVRRQRHPGPRGKRAHGWRAEIGRHANQVADVEELAVAVLGNRTAEVVVRGDRVESDPGVVRFPPHLEASISRHVGGIAVRPLAIDELFERQRRTAIPDAQVRDAVKTDFHGETRNTGTRLISTSSDRETTKSRNHERTNGLFRGFVFS